MADSYQLRDADSIKVQPLDYMSLLFDKISGITHIIAEPSPQIIEAMSHEAMTSQQIEHYLLEHYELQSDFGDNRETFEDIIVARLEEFIDLGIVVKMVSE